MSTMHHTLVPGDESIRTLMLADGVRYVLPYRSGTWMRNLGIVVVIISLFSTVFGIGWLAFNLASLGGSGGSSTVFSIVFAAIGLVPLTIGLITSLIGFGLMRGRSRCEVEITQDHLRVIEFVGPLRKGFRKPLDLISELILEHSVPGQNASSQSSGDAGPSNISGIVANCGPNQRLVIGAGYPIALLRELADTVLSEINKRSSRNDQIELTDRASAPSSSHRAGHGAASTVAGDEPHPRRRRRTAHVARPADTDITIDINGAEMNIYVPPAGLMKGTKGLFIFAIIWLGFMAVFSAVWIPAWLTQGGGQQWTAACVLPFWIIGIGMMMGAINMGRRQAYIDVVEGSLLISRKGLFGIKQQDFTLDDITDVRAGPSGMTVNEVPILELQFITSSAGKYGMLSQRKDDELRWLAYELREHLHLNNDHAADDEEQ